MMNLYMNLDFQFYSQEGAKSDVSSIRPGVNIWFDGNEAEGRLELKCRWRLSGLFYDKDERKIRETRFHVKISGNSLLCHLHCGWRWIATETEMKRLSLLCLCLLSPFLLLLPLSLVLYRHFSHLSSYFPSSLLALSIFLLLFLVLLQSDIRNP